MTHPHDLRPRCERLMTGVDHNQGSSSPGNFVLRFTSSKFRLVSSRQVDESSFSRTLATHTSVNLSTQRSFELESCQLHSSLFFSFSFYLSLFRSFFLSFFLSKNRPFVILLSTSLVYAHLKSLFVSASRNRKDRVSCFSLVRHAFDLLSPSVWSVGSRWHFVDYSGRYWGNARVTELRRKRERQVFLVLVQFDNHERCDHDNKTIVQSEGVQTCAMKISGSYTPPPWFLHTGCLNLFEDSNLKTFSACWKANGHWFILP